MTKDTSALSKRVFNDVLGDPTPSPQARVRGRAKLRRRLASSRRWRSIIRAGFVVGLATLCAVLVTQGLSTQVIVQQAEPVVALVSNPGAPLSEGLIEFPSGARVSIANGSIVHLISDSDQGTTLRVTRGEVMAQVETRESSRPFVVLADEVEVKVVGTTFVVSSDADHGVRVRGYEGSVWVSRGGERAVVGAGDVWPAGIVALPIVDEDGIAERLHLEEAREEPIASQADDGIPDIVTKPRQPVAVARKKIPEASFADALALERDGKHARSLALYRVVSATKGTAQEDALYAVGRMLRTQMQRSKEALLAFENYRKRFPKGRYALAVDVHILDLVVSSKDWQRADVEASRFLSERGSDPRAPHFRLARIKARLSLGDCTGLAEDLAATPSALTLPNLLQVCPKYKP